MNEPEEKKEKEYHSQSQLKHFHCQVTQAQIDEIKRHCLVYSKSEGKFVREAVSYLLGFYSTLESQHPKPKGKADDKKGI